MNPIQLFLYLCAVAAGLGVIGLVAIGLLALYFALVGASQRAANLYSARNSAETGKRNA